MSFKSLLKVFVALSLLLFPVLSPAQDMSLLSRFYSSVEKSCLDMTYSYSVCVSGIDNKGQGTLLCQGLMWKVNGNGVEMYCDAESVWIIDAFAKEVVIEQAPEDDQTQWMSNPAVIFTRLDELFKVNESLEASDGKAVIYVLAPREKNGIECCNVEILKSDASIRRASIALSDGTMIKIEVSSMKLTPELPIEAFRPQIVFDSSWILTDLR